MQVVKILRVESSVHLWTLLKNREEIFEGKNDLVYFLDYVENYVNGCKCDEDVNYDNMISIYCLSNNINAILNKKKKVEIPNLKKN